MVGLMEEPPAGRFPEVLSAPSNADSSNPEPIAGSAAVLEVEVVLGTSPSSMAAEAPAAAAAANRLLLLAVSLPGLLPIGGAAVMRRLLLLLVPLPPVLPAATAAWPGVSIRRLLVLLVLPPVTPASGPVTGASPAVAPASSDLPVTGV